MDGSTSLTLNKGTTLSKAVREYLRQLRESGEEELCLKPETLRKLYSTIKTKPAIQKETSKIAPAISEPKAKVKITKNPELEKFHQEIKDCTKCRLHQGRTKFVFGVGNPKADIMFIGEGPGRDEDLKGEPFVGRAGQLLDKILTSIGFNRQMVYIANMVKCRPPENRAPQPDEMDTCYPYLARQIELIKPKIICCLGRISGQYLLKTSEALGRLRGRVHDFNASTALSTSGIKLIVTYHPAALLRYPEYKKETWEDMKMLRKIYEEL